MIKNVTREEAIRVLEAWVEHDEKMEYADRLENIEIYKMAIEALKETERNPTITSWYDFDRGYEKGEAGARPHGEWIEQRDNYGDPYYECSVCKDSFITLEGTPKENHYNFCPNCGADMREGDPDDRA